MAAQQLRAVQEHLKWLSDQSLVPIYPDQSQRSVERPLVLTFKNDHFLNHRRAQETLTAIFNERWKEQYGRTSLLEYGSAVTGLYTSDSDYDLIVYAKRDYPRVTRYAAVNNDRYPWHDPEVVAELLIQKGFTMVHIIWAKVPLVRCQDPRNQNCMIDINLLSCMAVQHARLIYEYVKYDKRAKEVLLGIKALAMDIKIVGARIGLLNNISLVLAGIAFLQTERLLPNLQSQTLQGGYEEETVHRTTNAEGHIVTERIAVKFWVPRSGRVPGFTQNCTKSSSQLLLEFSTWFEQRLTDPDSIVSIAHGGLRSVNSVPENDEMAKQRRRRRFVVQDPFVKDNNTAYAAKPDLIEEVIVERIHELRASFQ